MCNDLAEAMKALDGKKTQHYAETRDPPSQDPRDHIGASHQGTGEDHFLESKKLLRLRPRK